MRLLVAVLAALVLHIGGAPLVSSGLRAPSVGTALAAPGDRAIPTEADFRPYWVAAHADTTLWSDSTATAAPVDAAYQWSAYYVLRPSRGGRLFVWSPAARGHAWIDANAVGPIDPDLAGTGYLPPIGKRVAWTGAARVTMYTCVELGGCNATASGHWPEIGMVAVDPNVIPLGSTIWIQGLGTFLAADTGSLVRGAHIDVFSTSYYDAIQWGVQSLPIMVFEAS
jgi:3D (Asp-Asp-Asp) domain-containing protein